MVFHEMALHDDIAIYEDEVITGCSNPSRPYSLIADSLKPLTHAIRRKLQLRRETMFCPPPSVSSDEPSMATITLSGISSGSMIPSGTGKALAN